jgi:hypothetical protein
MRICRQQPPYGHLDALLFNIKGTQGLSAESAELPLAGSQLLSHQKAIESSLVPQLLGLFIVLQACMQLFMVKKIIFFICNYFTH